MHSFCAEISVSYFKTNCTQNIYKVGEQLLSCRTDKRTSCRKLDTVDVCIVNSISSPIHNKF